MSQKLIVANWKMNGSVDKVVHDLSLYAQNNTTNKDNIVLALPSIYLSVAKTQYLLNTNIKVASQDVSIYNGSGAYTGEVSANLLKDSLVEYVLVGHSERRHVIGENDETLINKIKNVFTNGMTPIFCIGELLDAREDSSYLNVIENQLSKLSDVGNLSGLVIAYEPCWSIGTGKIPTLDEINEVVVFIHQYMQKHFEYAKISVLYGGSVTSQNASEILSVAGVDGVLVGGASLKPEDFTRICSYA